MFKNFFILAVRNLLKRKVFSFINIFGLAIGVAACLIILSYIDFETSYDKFNTNRASLYRINRSFLQNEERKPPIIMTTYGLGPALAVDLPEVKRYIRTHEVSAVVTYQTPAGEAKTFHENKIKGVDSTFFHAFTFKAISGDLMTSLDDPNSIVLTHSIARKYLGTIDPIGETITIAGGRMSGVYTVSAVIEDVPQNSHFDFDILLPLHNIFLEGQYKDDDGWGWNNFTTYVQLNEGASQEAAEKKLPAFCKRRLDPKWKDFNGRIELHFRTVARHPSSTWLAP